MVSITEARAENALSIPREALKIENGTSFVYVVEGGRIHKTVVETGLFNLTRIQILKGIPEGANIVLRASNINAELKDGATVTVEEEESIL
jgi:hypothetical protein